MINIHHILENLGLSPENRPLKIHFSNPKLKDLLIFNTCVKHSINSGIYTQAFCLSTDPFIPLKEMIGTQVALDMQTDQGMYMRSSGIVTGAEHGESDGALTVYKLTIQDPTILWKNRRNSRVFMNKTILDIVDIIYKEWQEHSPLFAKSLTLDIKGIHGQYDVRPFIMQSNETDYDFISRLLRSEGINWLIDETQQLFPISNGFSTQRLRLIDNNSAFNKLERGHIRYHLSRATEKTDTIHKITAKRKLQPTAIHVQRWQADHLEQSDWPESSLSNHQHSSSYENQDFQLEQSWHLTPAWISDLNGDDRATQSSNAQLEKLNANLLKFSDLNAKKFKAEGSVRDIAVGYWFELREHPEIDRHDAQDRKFLILDKTSYFQNNLPKELKDSVQEILKDNNWSNALDDERNKTQMSLVRSNIPVVPEYHPDKHKPTAYPQHARVVGPSGETIFVDEWGRIKVRFLFSRPDDNTHDGGSGTNETDTDSAFVDVLTPWAGEGFGTRFLPRVGEIVVIDFFNGDVDRPYVLGRIHESERSPTRFDIKGKLPETRKLSDIRSNEIGASGFNQLRFDDTEGQISAQIQSSFGASQINLGQLSHPKEAETSQDRGTGFEVRTDEFGAIRAGKGLLITSYEQGQAEHDQMEADQAKQQLEKSYQYTKSLNDVAKKHETDQIETIEQLKSFGESIQKDIAKFNQAMLLLSSPQGIALSTEGDIHLSSDGHINQIASGHIDISTQKSFIAHAIEKISLFAVKLGLKMTAAYGKVEIEAQTGEMDLIADKDLHIMSRKNKIEITAAEEILLNVKGNYFKITADGIEQGTKGESKVYTSKHSILGPKAIDYHLPQDPFNEMFVLKDPQGNPVAGFAYKIVTAEGQVFRGISNDKGETIRFNSGFDTTTLEIYPDDGEE